MRWEWREKEGGIEGRGRERHGGRWREQRGLDKKRKQTTFSIMQVFNSLLFAGIALRSPSLARSQNTTCLLGDESLI